MSKEHDNCCCCCCCKPKPEPVFKRPIASDATCKINGSEPQTTNPIITGATPAALYAHGVGNVPPVNIVKPKDVKVGGPNETGIPPYIQLYLKSLTEDGTEETDQKGTVEEPPPRDIDIDPYTPNPKPDTPPSEPNDVIEV